MGTLSPLTGLAGLPAGINEIQSSFTATMTPNAGCGTGTTLSPGCDAAVINAATVPEPATWTLLGIVSIGLLAGYKFRLFGFSRRAKI
jgi:hypothetical protein